ncbi:hypothetical protein U9M48_026263 [Paspalum notatum var. saurae]|uniref:Uncharacterized protein n=1 Tax=Paspalum notatum var. saurae TaxID=547442 RepID=A0AAQ3TX03_PASNO
MKPRPLGSVAAAAAEGLVGAGHAGWAWRPRPRGVSPKCSHSSPSSSAAAVHLERRRGGTNRGPFRQRGLHLTEYGSELEARVEKVIYACRFITFLGIGGLLLGSVPCFLKVLASLVDSQGFPPLVLARVNSDVVGLCCLQGCVYVMDAFVEYYLHGGGKVVLMLLEALEMFLMGTVTFVFGTGLYELFISNIDIAKGSNLFGLFRLPGRPKWLVIPSVNDLKTKLGHVIVMLLLVGIFENSKTVTITSCADLLCFSASIFLSSGCLYLLSRLSSTKGGSNA